MRWGRRPRSVFLGCNKERRGGGLVGWWERREALGGLNEDQGVKFSTPPEHARHIQILCVGSARKRKAKKDETCQLASHKEKGEQICTWYRWVMSVPTRLTYVAVW